MIRILLLTLALAMAFLPVACSQRNLQSPVDPVIATASATPTP